MFLTREFYTITVFKNNENNYQQEYYNAYSTPMLHIAFTTATKRQAAA